MNNPNRLHRITAENVSHEIVNLKQVVFEVTDECNLSCKYCLYGGLYGGFDHQQINYLQFNDVKTVLDYLVEIWRTHSSLAEHSVTYIGFYGGEPLLNFGLIQRVVDYVEKMDVPRSFRFSMTSNCLLLDRYMDYIVDKNFHLLCSLDGNKAANGYRVRRDGSSSFDKVFSNIKRLKEKYPEYFEQNVSFNSVLHNLNSVQETSGFLKAEFGKTPSFSELSPVGVRPEKVAEFRKTFQNLNESIHKAKDYDNLRLQLGAFNPETQSVMRYLEAYEENTYYSYWELFEDNDSSQEIMTGTCVPFGRKMFVTVDGKLLPCERIPHQFSLGTVSNGKVTLDYEAIAKKFNSLLDKMERQCVACSRNRFCAQCIYQIGSIDQTCPHCESYMTKDQFVRFRNSIYQYLYEYPETYELIMKKIKAE